MSFYHIRSRERAKYEAIIIIFNNYSPKAKLILLNNCLSIFTRSDLNRIRTKTIETRLVRSTGEFIREDEAVNSGWPKGRSLQYLQTWHMIVLIFLYRVL